MGQPRGTPEDAQVSCAPVLPRKFYLLGSNGFRPRSLTANDTLRFRWGWACGVAQLDATILRMLSVASFFGVPVGAVAWYAAALSTITVLIQAANYFRDRGRVVIKARKNMATPEPGKYAGMKLVIVSATNVGRRPVTVQGFGVRFLFGRRTESDWFLPDIHPQVPCEITEGKEVAAFLDQASVDFDSISHWYAWASAGRFYRLNVAPWHRRWVSEWRRRRSAGES